jgi:anaerobic ribonucleoside-triphosphate reductase
MSYEYENVFHNNYLKKTIMKPAKKLGIWMDHSIAYLMEFTANPFEIKTIESKFTHLKKMEAFAKSESLMHLKEKQQQRSYYKKLSEVIKDYKRVLLFGPTNAKMELFDILSEDERFVKIKIEIKETDKMTANQKDAFVKSYFSKS